MRQRRWWIAAALALPLAAVFASADEPTRNVHGNNVVPVRCQDGIPILSRIPVLGALFIPAPAWNAQGVIVPPTGRYTPENVATVAESATIAAPPSDPTHCIGFIDSGVVCTPPTAAASLPPAAPHAFIMARPGCESRMYKIDVQVSEGKTVKSCPKLMTDEGQPARIEIAHSSDDGKTRTFFRLFTRIVRDADGAPRLNLRVERTCGREKGEGKIVESTHAMNVSRKVTEGKKIRIPWEKLPGDKQTTCIELTVNEFQQPAPAPRMVEAATVAPCEIRAVLPQPVRATTAITPVTHCEAPIACGSEPKKEVAKGMVFQVKTEKDKKVLEIISPNGGRMTCQAIEMKVPDEVETTVKISIRDDRVFITEGDRGGVCGQIHRVEATATRVTMDAKNGELILEGKVRVQNRQGCDIEAQNGMVRVSFGITQTGVISSPQLAQ